MHILLVSTFGFDAAFPSRPEYLQARALARRGHALTAYEYYAPHYPGQAVRHAWLSGPVAVHRCSTLGFFSPEALLRMLLAERPAIVHVHHLRNLLAFQVVMVARRMGWPVVLTPHGLLHDNDLVVDRDRPLEQALRFDRVITSRRIVMKRLRHGAHPRRTLRNYLLHAPLRLVNGVVALSEHEREVLLRLGIAPERITVLPNAVDLGQFDGYQAEYISQADRNTLTPNGPQILYIGQLIERKGYDLLAHAMPLIIQEFPQARFIFVSHNRRDEARLQQIVAANGVASQLQLLGAVDETQKLRLLHTADVVVAPSRYEGFGIPLIEAMAARRPVITTDVPAGNEVVQHEQTGLLVPYDDVAALAAATIRVLRDPHLAQRLGANGRRQVEAHYTSDYLAEQLAGLYTSIK